MKGKRIIRKVFIGLAILPLALFILLLILIAFSDYRGLLKFSGPSLKVDWRIEGTVPLDNPDFPPQGMCYVQSNFASGILISHHWNDEKSSIHLIDPRSMAELGRFDMPTEAYHTGGLAWDGENLWAVDDGADKIYKLDLKASLETGEAEVLQSWNSGLLGTSGCGFAEWNGQKILAVSDFKASFHTYLIDLAALEAEPGYRPATDFSLASYRNEGLSQGITAVNGYLLEGENKAWKSAINIYSIDALLESDSTVLGRITTANRGVQDLAWDGQSIWLSDAVDQNIYRALPDQDLFGSLSD